jgi:carbon monoxide dehydrogenase subunit G
MEINNSFEVPLPPDEAWRVLMDIPRIAPCMPGAELTGVLDSETYTGKVSVRLGPVALSFSGQVKFEDVDNAHHSARVKAQGKDTKGRGGANANVDFHLESIPGGSRVRVKTDLLLSGAVAQYGRASGVIQEVASQLIGQFAECLKRQLETSRAVASAIPSARPELDATIEVRPVREMPVIAGTSATAAGATEDVDPLVRPVRETPIIAATTPKTPAAPAAPMASPAVKPISGFTLLAKVLWNSLKRLFAKK